MKNSFIYHTQLQQNSQSFFPHSLLSSPLLYPPLSITLSPSFLTLSHQLHQKLKSLK